MPQTRACVTITQVAVIVVGHGEEDRAALARVPEIKPRRWARVPGWCTRLGLRRAGWRVPGWCARLGLR